MRGILELFRVLVMVMLKVLLFGGDSYPADVERDAGRGR